jgi:hypothetical protein
MECILASHTRHAECSRIKHVATHNLQQDAKMGSVELITPSTLAIPVVRYSTRIKHVVHLVWLCKKVSLEGPIRRTREGGSEWEPIKVLLEGDGNSNQTNTASNTRLQLTTKVGQAHIATGVPLDLGTNTPPSDLRNAAEKPSLESTDPHRSDR